MKNELTVKNLLTKDLNELKSDLCDMYDEGQVKSVCGFENIIKFMGRNKALVINLGSLSCEYESIECIHEYAAAKTEVFVDLVDWAKERMDEEKSEEKDFVLIVYERGALIKDIENDVEKYLSYNFNHHKHL